MANKRIHEIAKETSLKSKDVMDKLEQMGIAARTASSSITTDQYEAFKNRYPKLYEGGVGTGAPPISGKERVVTVVRTDQENQVTEKVTERRVSRTVIRRRSRGDEGTVEDAQAEAAEAEAPQARPGAMEDSPLLRVTEAPRGERPRIELPEPKPAEPEAAAPVAPAEPETEPEEVAAAPEAPAASEETAAPAPRARIDVVDSDAPRLKIIQPVKSNFKPRVEAAPPPAPGAPAQIMPGEPPPEDAEGRKKSRKAKKTREGGARDETDWRETKRMIRKRRDFVDAENLPSGRDAGGRRKGKRRGAVKKVLPANTKPAQKKPIRIDESITLGEMAAALGVKAAELIRELMDMGVMATANQAIDLETAELLAATYDYEVERVGLQENEILRQQTEDKPEDLKPRPPVVTIMGHVDHGKTSLLDKIREARVAEGEAGGITQHIGAYHVDTSKGPLTFLDTPGHEAFTAMRARGAKVTDIVVLVIAADDGVKPQTIEAINHSKAAGVPIVVAVNKIDKPGAKPEQARQQLTEFGLVAEEWGGETMFVNVSAKTGEGVDTLLETIALQSEVLELKANPDKAAAGIIVEARLERGRGPVATVLIQEGTLHLGDAIVAGQHFGKARAMTDDLGKSATAVGPGMPVELLGLSGVPAAGDFFDAAANEKLAKQVAAKRAHKVRESELASLSRTSLEQLYAKISAGEAKELPVVVKADVQGSVEAIVESLNNLSLQRCQVKVIHSGAGGVTESDVNLAAASNAIIVAFNVRPERMAAELADSQQIQIKHYSVIYDLIDDITAAMEGLLEPDRKETIIGHAEVREVYSITKVGKVAGCYVTDGKATRGAFVRVLRDNTQIYQSQLSSLKRFKDDAKEVPAGMECGLTVKDYSDVRSGDVLEFYEIEEIAVKLADVRVKEAAAAQARAQAQAQAEAEAKAAADPQQATT